MNDKFTGHTPGPWEWDSWHQIQNVFYAHELCASDGSFVLETTNPQNGRVLMVMSRSDAHLIAAAPDLLIDNQRLREAIKNHRRNIWGDGYVGHHEDAALYDTLKEKS